MGSHSTADASGLAVPGQALATFIVPGVTDKKKVKVMDSVVKILSNIPTTIDINTIKQMVEYFAIIYQTATSLEIFYQNISSSTKIKESPYNTKYAQLILFLIGKFNNDVDSCIERPKGECPLDPNNNNSNNNNSNNNNSNSNNNSNNNNNNSNHAGGGGFNGGGTHNSNHSGGGGFNGGGTHNSNSENNGNNCKCPTEKAEQSNKTENEMIPKYLQESKCETNCMMNPNMIPELIPKLIPEMLPRIIPEIEHEMNMHNKRHMRPESNSHHNKPKSCAISEMISNMVPSVIPELYSKFKSCPSDIPSDPRYPVMNMPSRNQSQSPYAEHDESKIESYEVSKSPHHDMRTVSVTHEGKTTTRRVNKNAGYSSNYDYDPNTGYNNSSVNNSDTLHEDAPYPSIYPSVNSKSNPYPTPHAYPDPDEHNIHLDRHDEKEFTPNKYYNVSNNKPCHDKCQIKCPKDFATIMDRVNANDPGDDTGSGISSGMGGMFIQPAKSSGQFGGGSGRNTLDIEPFNSGFGNYATF
ncbi:MAG: hypothetical protein Gaeavirus22_1 [Gaeavirus sp.]|uniref:Uncharacterized protein n=1 Tax=Gaeavirus sp. TaxID=2487767 RepID=A0A3G5A353_9VIRU|nr:MAG: hypothetical protein Gaeavirus22_1 [Gaeavirus sp.]